MKLFRITLSGLGLLLILAPANAAEVRIAGTGGASQDAYREAWFKPFQNETGIKIIEDEYDQKMGIVRAQVESGNLKWDIVVTTQLILKVGCDEGIFEKIDWSGKIDTSGYAEPVTECGVPVVNSSGVLVYDGARYGDDGPKTWRDFWNVQKFPGKRGLWFGPQETLEVALLADGVPPQEVNEALAAPGGVDRAFAKLEEIKDDVIWWKSGSESLQLLGSGETVMTYAWNGRVAAANDKDNRDFRIVWNAGHPNGSSTLSILKGSPNLEPAIEFIKYVSRPESGARYSALIPYGPPNLKALDLIDPERRKMLPGPYMDFAQSQADDTYAKFWLENLDTLSARFANWVAN